MLPNIDELAQSYINRCIKQIYDASGKILIEVLYKINTASIYYTDIFELLTMTARERTYVNISRSHKFLTYIKTCYNQGQIDCVPHTIKHLVEFKGRTFYPKRELNMSICRIKQISPETYEKLKKQALKHKYLYTQIIVN